MASCDFVAMGLLLLGFILIQNKKASLAMWLAFLFIEVKE